jgi:archaellum component FlaG (FlaF/FlaG flagellin family)
VNSVDRSKTAGDPSNEIETVTAQGEFLNVHMTVTNVGDRTQSFFASNQKLFIGGNEFSPNGTAAMWIGSMSVDINPGNSVQAVVSFDVPPGTSNGGVLTVHDAIFSGGAKISLQQPGQ